MATIDTTQNTLAAPARLADRYTRIRGTTVRLCEPLSAEDMVVQAVEETSPAKWHLAHTTWFFETFVLEVFEPDFRAFDPAFRVLFNSYYQQVGERHPRPRRGVLTRPGLGEVMAYRDTVDDRVRTLLRTGTGPDRARIAALIELGLQHEQQHQELLLMDVKRLLHMNPTRPAYAVGDEATVPAVPGDDAWISCDGGLTEIGHAGGGFAYDNEGPRHRRWVDPFEIAARPVTNGAFLAFIEDGGYRRPELWLDEGWSAVTAEGWEHPIYWSRNDGGCTEFTLAGTRPLDPDATACHLSFFEAEAFARWAGARLPTEAEWELAATPVWERDLEEGQFLDRPGRGGDASSHGDGYAVGPRGTAGGVWEWTRSAHEPYPGYRPPEGAIGEYNGKFMCGSFVLRGGSCVTPSDHVRLTYRNFFRPGARWAFAGVRLARDLPRTERRGAGAEADAAVAGPTANVLPTIRGRETPDDFARDAAAGLAGRNGLRHLPPKYLYDARGSRLFEAICDTAEYYVPDAEREILRTHGPEMAAAIGRGAVLIEPGAGDGSKAQALLGSLEAPRMYVPVEISPDALRACAARVGLAFPGLTVQPVCAGFRQGMDALRGVPCAGRTIYFAGSTIGNMERTERVELLGRFARVVGASGRLLVGFDLRKDPDVLRRAYDDARGVSARFALNLIRRLNRELDAGLEEDAFRYEAVWDASASRIEMALVCERDQTARIGERSIVIPAGEKIVTERSYKFTPETIRAESAEAGLVPSRAWTDEREWFSLVLLEPARDWEQPRDD
jgi:dimethylhistidine N-methyltransferase